MPGPQQDTSGGNTPYSLETDHHIALVTSSRSGKSRSIIIPDLLDRDRRVDQNSADPKPRGGAHDPTR